jgi:hypothetical protein
MVKRKTPLPLPGAAASGYRPIYPKKYDFFWDVTQYGSCKNNVSEELSSSIIIMTTIGEVGTLAVTRNRRTLTLFLAHRFLSP